MSMPVSLEPGKRFNFLTATIPINQTVSGAVDLLNYALRGLIIPPSFEGTVITFQASSTLAGTYNPVVDDTGAAIQITGVVQNNYIVFGAAVAEKLNACDFLKLISNFGVAAARAITLVGVASTK